MGTRYRIIKNRPQVYMNLAKFLNGYLTSLDLNSVQVEKGFKNVYNTQTLEDIILNVYTYLHKYCQNYLVDKIIHTLDMSCENYDFFEKKEFGDVLSTHKPITIHNVSNDLGTATIQLNNCFKEQNNEF